jgi:sporulation protein YlmC with PRC-barrel domain
MLKQTIKRRYTIIMLLLSTDLLKKQVLSLRTNTPNATVIGPIINPNNLKIEGFHCRDRYNKAELILVSQDIRETLANGYIVNDHDVLVKVEDLIRLKDVININFNLIGKQVETISKHKVGKVTDYATDIDSMFVQKLYVGQPIYKNLSGGNLVVDRSQINEITPKRIIINDLLGTVPVQARASIV